jgi:isopropylmalate/homocitrate/citramalate synthase/4-hydroxybenzoate polyprenyltransferase
VIHRTLLAHLETMRPYTSLYVGLVGSAGALLSNNAPNELRLLGAFAAPTLGWIAGLYCGDYFDRRLDAIAKPYRPIPSGRIPARVALAFMVLYIVAGMAIALSLGIANLLVALIVLVIGISYSKLFKAQGVWGHFARGILMNLTFIFGMLATTGQIKLAVLPLSFVFFFHDTFTNAIGAIRDMEGDRAGGYLTFPVKYGPLATLRFGGLLYACWAALALLYPLTLNIRAVPYYSLLTVTIVMGVASYVQLWTRRRAISRVSALSAHKTLVLERLFLASALVGAATGWTFALAVLLPSLVITWISQFLLRDRYEFPAKKPDTTCPIPTSTAYSRTDISEYVDRQLSYLRQNSLQLLRNWPRRLEIRVVDQDLAVSLLIEGGLVQRVSEAVFQASSRPKIIIQTDARTFQAIFIDRTSSPYQAYAQGRIKLECPPLDMIRLNQVFTAFLRERKEALVSDVQQAEPQDPLIEKELMRSPAMHGELRHQVVISDTTLRDGEQMPGVAFSVAEKIAIAKLLDELGVPLLEVGFPAVSDQESVAIKEIVRLGLRAVVQVIARPLERDIDAALLTGANSIAIFIGTSDAHVFNKLRTSRSAIIEQVTHAIAYAKQSGVQVIFAPEDATRTPPDFLQHACQTAIEAGADIIAIPDTAGVITPWAMSSLVRHLTHSLRAPIAVHCHNDLGLATANSIAGLLAGASGVQCSLMGIGERAGNASLEEVATILEVIYGCRTGLDLTRLAPAAQELSRILGYPLGPNKAVVGTNAFVHESGLHTDGIVRDPTTYEPFAPERVGQQRRFIFGKHTGRRAIQHVLEAHGLASDEALCQQLLDQVKKMGEAKHPLDESGLIHLAIEPSTWILSSQEQSCSPVVENLR